MKTTMEVLDGVLVIETEEEDLKIVIDVATGEIIHFEHQEISILRLDLFIKAAKVRYKKYLAKKVAEDFLQ